MKNCDDRVGHAGPIVNVGLEPRTNMSGKELPVAHTTKVTLPTPAFISIKSYINPIHPNVAYAIAASQRFVSRHEAAPASFDMCCN